MAKLLTYDGQVIDPTTYIYICAVNLKTGPRFGGFKVKTGPNSKLKTGPSLFHCLPPLIVFLGHV